MDSDRDLDLQERTIVAFSAPYRLTNFTDEHRDNNPFFKIRKASSTDRLSKASDLIKERYAWRGYSSGALVASPHYVTLLAYSDEILIGTMTLGIDSESGLSVDQAYRAEVDGLRSNGGRIAEITKLATENTTSSKHVLAALIHITYIYARYVHKRTDFLIEVNPKHVNYYERRLGFQRLGAERICERVNAPACLMHIDLDYMGAQIALVGGRGSAGSKKTLYPYFFHKLDEEGISARLVEEQ